jgi:hypothetical protein
MMKRETSPCRVPCHLGRMGFAVVVVSADGVAVEAGVAAAGIEVLAEEPEPSLGGMSRNWGWPEGQKNCGDMFDQAPAESTGRR